MRQITVSNIDRSLFHIAARELGDALQWWRIASINGLLDPDLTGLEQSAILSIPDIILGQDAGYPES